jgi:Ca-activated chloride channel family protein
MDHDLDALRAAPAPDPEAKRRAVAAALAAFDAADAPSCEKTSEPPQGNASTARLTIASNRKGRSMVMTSRRALIAATLTLAAAAPALFTARQWLAPTPLQNVANVEDQAPSVASGSTATHVQPTLKPMADARSAAGEAPRPGAPPTPQQMADAGAAVGQSHPNALPAQASTSPAEAKTEISKTEIAQAPAVSAEATTPSAPAPSARPATPAAAAMAADKTKAKAPTDGAPLARERQSSTNVAQALRLDQGWGSEQLAQPLARSDAPAAAAEPSFDAARFPERPASGLTQVAAEPVSTFSLDVDTTSYTVARRALSRGALPPRAAVRVEEMINYFPYAYPKAESADPPFRPTITVAPSPWTAGRQIVHVAIKGYEPLKRPPTNLVLLVDVSGSMAPADRLPLIQQAFSMFVDQLGPEDTVSIVTYASGSGVALAPTSGSDKAKIKAALARLTAGGSTAGAQGLADAYRLARDSFKRDGVNRILLATDGDFNVGVSSPDELKRMVERERKSGVSLSILGVGQDNYQDSIAQALAQNGNGAAAYVDTIDEARKVLVEQSAATLTPIANDVKVQIEWNPAQVSDYRLVGYEKRALAKQDFANDAVDAGDVGAGHTVTAIYEITPKGSPLAEQPLRYGAPQEAPARRVGNDTPTELTAQELGFLKMRYKIPGQATSKLIETPIAARATPLAQTSDDVRFSLAVAGFGQLLRGDGIGAYGYDDVMALAEGARGSDPNGYRAEFLKLARLAKALEPAARP